MNMFFLANPDMRVRCMRQDRMLQDQGGFRES